MKLIHKNRNLPRIQSRCAKYNVYHGQDRSMLENMTGTNENHAISIPSSPHYNLKFVSKNFIAKICALAAEGGGAQILSNPSLPGNQISDENWVGVVCGAELAREVVGGFGRVLCEVSAIGKINFFGGI